MKRVAFAVSLLAALIGWAGCGEAKKKPASMGEVRAALDQQGAGGVASASAADAEAGSANTPADGGRATAANSAPAATHLSLGSKRGFDLEDWSNEAAYVLVKSDASATAEALAKVLNGKVLRDMLGKKVDENADQLIVYQLAGHPWSVFACSSRELEKLTPELSKEKDVLVFWNSDFNGWAGIEFYRNGEEVEAVHWGPEEDGLGEDGDPSQWHAEGKKTISYDDSTFAETYRFRGKERKVTSDELQKGDAFLDDMFRRHDAYLPDQDQMPWFDYDTYLISSPLGKGAFTAVHAVEVNGT